MSVLVDHLEDAVLVTLKESGLVLDAVQLAERLSAMPSDVEQIAEKLVEDQKLQRSPGRFGTCYSVPHVARRRDR